MRFTAAAPAMAFAFDCGNLTEAVRYIRMMLEPSQRRFPDYLEQTLNEEITAFDNGDIATVTRAIEIVKPDLSEAPFCYISGEKIMILIVGASSSLGQATIPLLRAAGFKLRLASRNPQKLQAFQGDGIEIIQADLLNPASLEYACEGIEKVFAAAHSILGRGKSASNLVDDAGNRALIDIARKHAVKHFVYTSILGASANSSTAFFRNKSKIEAYLKESGLPYTILRPSAFFVPHTVLHSQAFFKPQAALRAFLTGDKATVFGKGNTPRNYVAIEDVAQFALIALTYPKAINQTIDIGGPENLTAREVAAIYGKVVGHTLRVMSTPLFVPQILRVLLKPFLPGLSDAMQLAVDADRVPAPYDVSGTLADYPVNLTRLEDWLRQQKSS